jgi:predicted MPP superfamily phosphohydrolase
LFLTGHVHGGQVALPFYGAIITLSKYGKKYEKGRYDIDGKVLYVNRGVGMEGDFVPRVRFFSRPEITVFHIRPLKIDN